MSATKEPCGECHLQPGETCDICGVTSSEPSLVSPTDPLRSEAATRKDAEAAAPKPMERLETVAVPKAALDWLMGAGPDPAGLWFGDFLEDYPKPPGQFWWRKTFRDICDYCASITPTAPKPDPTIAELVERLREDAEYLDNYFGFVGNQYRIVRNISDLIAALTASNGRVAELERENFTLAANQCDGPKRGDEYGHEYCPIVEKLTRERYEAIIRAATMEDRAEAAEATVGRLAEVLTPLAAAADSFDRMSIGNPEEWLLWGMSPTKPDYPAKQITVGDARRARAVLSTEQPKESNDA